MTRWMQGFNSAGNKKIGTLEVGERHYVVHLSAKGEFSTDVDSIRVTATTVNDLEQQVLVYLGLSAENYEFEIIVNFVSNRYGERNPAVVAVHKEPTKVPDKYRFLWASMCGTSPIIDVKRPRSALEACTGEKRQVEYARVKFTADTFNLLKRLYSDIDKFSSDIEESFKEMFDADPLGFLGSYDGLKPLGKVDVVKRISKKRKLSFSFDPLEVSRKKGGRACPKTA